MRGIEILCAFLDHTRRGTIAPNVAQLILPIKVEKSSERLTSLGGLLVLEETARGMGLWEEVDRVLEGPKSGRGYEARNFVRALVWTLHAGGRRLEDLRELRAEHDVLKKLGLEAVPDAGTVATLRWKLYRLAAKLVRHARGWGLEIKADAEKWALFASARLGCAHLPR